MRKLKIVYLAGGTFWHIKAYLRFFASRGHDVRLITFLKCDDTFSVKHYALLKEMNWNSSNWAKLRYFTIVPKIRKILREVKPDILHGHYATSAGMMCLLSGFKPYIVTAHGSDILISTKFLVWRSLLKRIFKKASLVNVVSKQLEILVKKLDVNSRNILVLTLGVDTSVFRFKPSIELSKPIKLLCTRRLSPVLDPLMIIKACQILKNKGIAYHMTFAASGLMYPEVQSRIQSENLEDQVSLLGGYKISELPQILHNHDFFISSSLSDGTSISLLEAMSSGIFPIVSRIESNKAWIEENKTGLMFDCGDAEELADRIMQAVENRDFILSAVEMNRKLVEEKADRQKNMLRLEKWYYDILK